MMENLHLPTMEPFFANLKIKLGICSGKNPESFLELFPIIQWITRDKKDRFNSE